MRAIEIHLITQKHKKLSILALRMQKRFCNTRKLKRTKTRKQKTGSKFGSRELCRMQKLPSRLPGRRGVGFFEPTISSTASEALRGLALVRPKDLAQGRNDVVRGAPEARKRIHV